MLVVRIRVSFVALTLGICTLSGCVDKQPESGAKPEASNQLSAVSKEELVSVLRSKNFDKAIETFNRIKAMHYQGELLPVLSDLWYGRLDASLDESFVKSPRIRIEIADVLVQATNNGAKTGPLAELAQFARAMSDSTDTAVASQGILVMGEVNEQQDVAALTRIALREERFTFEAAVASLAHSCWVDAPMIQRIEGELKSSAHRDFLEATWKNGEAVRQGICERFRSAKS